MEFCVVFESVLRVKLKCQTQVGPQMRYREHIVLAHNVHNINNCFAAMKEKEGNNGGNASR
jgi:hypothetical protein